MSRGLYEVYGDPLFPVTAESSYNMLSGFMSGMKYFKVMIDDTDKLVAWMACSEGHDQHHSSIKAFSQIYYHTNLSSIKAVKALVMFHNHYFEFAQKMGAQVVITSSYLPSKGVFTRVLEKNGWQEYGGRLRRLTNNYPRSLLGDRNSTL